MKKVLFATTALVATAGVAAADVTFGGLGRFGIMYSEGNTVGGTKNEMYLTHRLRLNIAATAESDNGLSFSGRFRVQADANADDTQNMGTVNGAQFGVDAGGLSVRVGNISGAIDSQAGMYNHSIGLTGLGDHNVVANSVSQGYWGFDGYSSTGAGRNGITVGYGAGNFNVLASYSNQQATGGDARTGLTASFNINDWTVSAGYQDSTNNAEDKMSLIVQGSLGIANVTLGYAQNNKVNKIMLGADIQAGSATTVSLFAAKDDSAGAKTSFGLGVNHDMGGGTSIRGGIVQTPGGTNVADLGLQFNF